jgi:hypothetical protein
VVSDRYMDQLASMKPFEEQQGKKFSLGCMLVERKGTDAEGTERGVLVTTQVDGPGTLGMAGVEKGDAVRGIYMSMCVSVCVCTYLHISLCT